MVLGAGEGGHAVHELALTECEMRTYQQQAPARTHQQGRSGCQGLTMGRKTVRGAGRFGVEELEVE